MKYTIVTHDNKIYHQGSNKEPEPIDGVEAIKIVHKDFGISYMWVSDIEECLTNVPHFYNAYDRIVTVNEAFLLDKKVRFFT